MEYSNAELAKELGAIISKVAQLEPEINRASIDSSASIKAAGEQAKRISALEGENQALRETLSEQAEDLKKQQLKDTEHQEFLDKLFRLTTETQKRLDGDSITNISYANYETVRETIKIVVEKMSGKGSSSYDEIVSTFSNTRFLAKVLGYMVGLFGVSGLIAGVLAVTGIGGGDGKLTVQKLSGEVNTLRKDVDANVKNLEVFKSEDFKDFKNSVTGNIKTLYDRQWDAAIKK